MSITRQDLIELFEAAVLDSKQSDIKSFIDSFEHPIKEMRSEDHDERRRFVTNLFYVFYNKNRAVYFEDYRLVANDIILETYNAVLAPFGIEIDFTQDDLKEIKNEIEFGSIGGIDLCAREIIQEKLIEKNLLFVEFNIKDVDHPFSYSAVIFQADKFETIDNNEVVLLIDVVANPYKNYSYIDEVVISNPISTLTISKKELIELFTAAGLNPEQNEIKTFLEGLEYPVDLEENKAFGFDLFDILEDNNRAVWLDWKAKYDEISKKFNKVLVDFGTELRFTDEEIKESEEDYTTATLAMDILNERFGNLNLEVVPFDTEQDSSACIFFQKEKLALIKNNNALKLF